MAAEAPQNAPDVLEELAHDRTVLDLRDAGLLSEAACEQALAALQGAPRWWRWANRSLLFVGSALLLAGVVFFFAHNWARMSSVAKFGVIEMGLWACAIGALRSGLDRITGKVLLLSASVLVGVLLAVYGQVYQTGADAFENYALWAGLILPWVIIAKFAALWTLWLTVANVALILFWIQVQVDESFEFAFGLFLILAAVNALALAGREYGATRKWDWLAGLWVRWLAWSSIIVYLIIPTIAFLVETEWGNGSFLGMLAFGATLAVGYAYFRHRVRDLLSLAIGVLGFCVAVLTLLGRLLFDVSEEAPMFLVFGLIVLGVTAAAAYYLRQVWSQLERDRHA